MEIITLSCLSMQPTMVIIAGYFCLLKMPHNIIISMCILLVFDSNSSNVPIKYKYVTSVMVKYKSKFKLHCISNTKYVFVLIPNVNLSLEGGRTPDTKSRTRVRIPFAAVSNFGHFCSLHGAPVHRPV